jgi:26S proteasome regulatory subunit N2
MHFMSLSFSPTVLIGLNKDFDMPTSFNVTCNTPASMFAYPKADEKKEDGKKQVSFDFQWPVWAAFSDGGT